MPTYTFICRKCENKFDVFTAISQKAGVKCPSCQSNNLREEFGPVFIGGKLSRPGAGQSGCHGSCTTCGSHCKH